MVSFSVIGTKNMLGYFSSPPTLLCAIFLDTDYWIGTDQHDTVGHIDEMMVKKFQQGKFADQTLQEAFYPCTLTSCRA